MTAVQCEPFSPASGPRPTSLRLSGRSPPSTSGADPRHARGRGPAHARARSAGLDGRRPSSMTAARPSRNPVRGHRVAYLPAPALGSGRGHGRGLGRGRDHDGTTKAGVSETGSVTSGLTGNAAEGSAMRGARKTSSRCVPKSTGEEAESVTRRRDRQAQTTGKRGGRERDAHSCLIRSPILRAPAS